MINPRYAILIDGGFITKLLSQKLKRFPTADDIISECDSIRATPPFDNYDFMRIYFYDAHPSQESLTNPIDGITRNLGATPRFREYTSLLDSLEMKPNVALRLGRVDVNGWEVGYRAMKDLQKNPRVIVAKDLVPNISQKEVDLRIGLDIARLSLKDMVRAIVVVTGDSDMVPAFKFARREGIQVYLKHYHHGVKRELKAHSDIIL